ncbi:hypothetical protein [Roseovarius sp.]|uniref:hypothetical protein n=1 Tax=Roseovarius sp. TaxID=1486281 RepID=UPI0035674AF5
MADVDDLQVDQTPLDFGAEQVARKDPEWFSIKRGAASGKNDMSLYGKSVTWRYNRKLMWEHIHEISLLD